MHHDLDNVHDQSVFTHRLARMFKAPEWVDQMVAGIIVVLAMIYVLEP